MGLFDMLLGGHHRGGHGHGGDRHHGGHGDSHGWGYGNGGPPGCAPAQNHGISQGAVLGANRPCTRCQSLNGEAAKFCQQCGESMTPAVCRNCNATLGGGAKFCNQCGKSCG